MAGPLVILGVGTDGVRSVAALTAEWAEIMRQLIVSLDAQAQEAARLAYDPTVSPEEREETLRGWGDTYAEQTAQLQRASLLAAEIEARGHSSPAPAEA